LTSHYGAISALTELGPEVQRAFIAKRLPAISEKLKLAIESGVPVEKTAAEHIKHQLNKIMPNIQTH